MTEEEILELKSKMKDKMLRPMTQALFLELGYDDYAIFTLKEQDYFYEGKMYPSIRRLFLSCQDPTEYEFANKYLLGWRHWQRIQENKAIRKFIDEWRDEFEVKLRAQGIGLAISAAKTGAFQASKWLASGEWKQRGAGRPSKAEVEREKKIQASLVNEFDADVVRLFKGA